MLILISMAFSFISCTDEDDKRSKIPQLVGKWSVKRPVLQDDFVTCYTFNADKTYEVYTGSPLSNGVPFRGTYIISLDEKLITLYDKEGHYTEQYHILKLTSKDMKWENASPKDGNSDKRLEKVQRLINFNYAGNQEKRDLLRSHGTFGENCQAR